MCVVCARERVCVYDTGDGQVGQVVSSKVGTCDDLYRVPKALECVSLLLNIIIIKPNLEQQF